MNGWMDILYWWLFYYTFRWKGENVATTEVSEVLGDVDFLQEANVYGVTIPGDKSHYEFHHSVETRVTEMD